METNLAEIKADLSKELRDETFKEREKENNSPIQIEEDFLDLDIIRALIQLKDGAALAIISKDTSENAQIIIRETLETDEDSVIRWRRVIQKFIRNKFPQWVDRLKGMKDQDLVILIVSDFVKISTAYSVRIEDKNLSENPSVITKFFSYFRKIFSFTKSVKGPSHGGV